MNIQVRNIELVAKRPAIKDAIFGALDNKCIAVYHKFDDCRLLIGYIKKKGVGCTAFTIYGDQIECANEKFAGLAIRGIYKKNGETERNKWRKRLANRSMIN